MVEEITGFVWINIPGEQAFGVQYLPADVCNFTGFQNQNCEEFTKKVFLIYLFMLLFFCEQGISIVSNLEN